MTGQRILVSRPAEAAERTAARLERLGFEPILAPVMTLEETPDPAPAGRFDHVLLTSAAVAIAGARLKPFNHLPALAVGERTAEIGRRIGFMNVDAADGDARSLVGRLRDLYPHGCRVLHIAGRHRKPDIERDLPAAGFEVITFAVYEGKAAPSLPIAASKALKSRRLDGAIHYSRRSATLLLALVEAAGLRDELAAIPHICLSQDVAEPLREAGFSLIEVAARPSEDALLAALQARSA